MLRTCVNLAKRAALAAAGALLSIVVSGSARADVLLEIDLSVLNQITINATTGLSAANASGTNTTGFYLAGFFGTDTVSSGTSFAAVSGNLTSANQTSDGTPGVFKANHSDPGLNVWSYVSGATSTFTAGLLAFTGSLTAIVPNDIYASALLGPGSGNVYFPAEDLSDLPNAVILGTWQVLSQVLPGEPGSVPEPGSLAMLALGVCALPLMRRRLQRTPSAVR